MGRFWFSIETVVLAKAFLGANPRNRYAHHRFIRKVLLFSRKSGTKTRNEYR